MKKLYILACATLVSGFAFAQGNSTFTKKYENPSKVVTGAPSRAIQAPVTTEKVDLLTEDWDSGNAFPNGWTVQSGPTSTITVPGSQDWHEATVGNTGNSAGVSYVNSIDTHDEWLISPSVVLPTTANPLRVSFDFYTSVYWHVTPFDNVDIFAKISTDGGTSWTDLWNEDTVAFEFQVWEPQMIDISSYQGQTVQIAFQYLGVDGAFFNLDNVRVAEITGVDMVHRDVLWNFQGQDQLIIPYNQVPVQQVQDVTTMVFAGNNGAYTAANGIADVIVSGPVSATVTTGMVDVAVGAVDTLYNIAGYNPNAVGTYTVTTALRSDSVEQNTADNSGGYMFDVTDYTYARDDNTLEGWFMTADDDGDNILDPVTFQQDYEIFTKDTLYALYAVFPAAVAWTDLDIEYNVFDGAGNALFDGVTNAIPSYNIEASELSPTDGSANNWVRLELNNTNTGGLGVELDPINGNVFTLSISHGIDSLALGVSGTAYANPGTWTTAGIVYSGSGGGGDAGYYITSDYMLRMDMQKPTSVNEELTNVALNQNVPNPANGMTQVSFSTENAAEVSFVVRDVTGKLISSEDYGTLPAGQHNINYNVGGLAEGVYYYSVVVNGNATTKKMAVAK